jgi:hypothetical protein
LAPADSSRHRSLDRVPRAAVRDVPIHLGRPVLAGVGPDASFGLSPVAGLGSTVDQVAVGVVGVAFTGIGVAATSAKPPSMDPPATSGRETGRGSGT